MGEFYTAILRRPVDPSGLAVWTGVLNAGTSQHQVALDLLSGVEYRDSLVSHFYEKMLGRSAEPLAVAAWSAELQNETLEQVQADIAGSTEFFDRAGGTNAGFLAALYQVLLHRSIDPSGAASFGEELISGKSRADVAMQILESTEYRTDLVNRIYQRFLHRAAEPAGSANWVKQLQLGMSDQGVIAGVVSSPEFRSVASAPPVAPTITSPTHAKTTMGRSLTITGTAAAGSLVQVRSSTGSVVGSEQLGTGAVAFSISVPLATNAANNFTVTATDLTGKASAPATVPTVTQSTSAVNVLSPAQQHSHEGDPVNLQVVATDLVGKTLTYSATGLPAGLSMGASTGGITGTITAGDSTGSPYTVTVTATDGTNSGTATFTWVVSPPAPKVTAPPTQLDAVGSTVTPLTVTATGTGPNPITYSATNLPSGLTIDSSTGVISGTISQAASNSSPYAVKVTATQNGQTATATFTWVVPTSATSTLPFSLTNPAWVTLPSGVRYLDQTVGTGATVKAGQAINVDYVGYLTDGTIFDQGTGFSSTLTAAHLIQGWVDAVPGTKVGGVRLLDIPSSLAYGASSPSSKIPANAELVFKITVNSVS